MSDAERTRTIPLLATALLFLAPCTLHAQVQYPVPVHQTWPQPYPPPPTVTVDPSGGGNYTTITAAVNAVASGTYIRVRAGIYREYGIDFGSKQLVLESVDGVGAAIVEAQPSANCVQLQAIFRLTQGQTGASAINGFTLRNGRAARGGAIYCYGTSPTIINNIFSNNSAALGGAVFSQFGTPQIAGNTFSGNGYGQGSASCGPDTFEGGGVCLVSSSAIVTGNLFQSNRATLGGGVDVVSNSHVTLSNNVFLGNFGNAPSIPGTTPKGGGLSVSVSSAVTVDHCEFTGNHATASGGGAWLSGQSGWATSFDHVVFEGNAAEQLDGGGLHLEGAAGSFTNCTFAENTADHYGGGLYCSGAGSPVFDTCEVRDNLAWTAGGGAAFAFDNSATIRLSQIHDNDVQAGAGVGKGGGIYVESASVTIRQNTINGNGRNSSSLGTTNKAWRGGAIAYAGAADGSSQGHIDSNVITFNEVQSYQSFPGEAAGVFLRSMGAGSSFGSNVVARNTLNNSTTTWLGVGAGVLVESTGSFRFFNNSIADNVNVAVAGVRGSGGGILFRNLTSTSSFPVYNSIIWGNLAAQNATNSDATVESVNVTTLPTLFYCDTPNAPNASAPDWVSGVGVIHSNPPFVNPAAGDYHIPSSATALINSGFNGIVNVTIRPFDVDIDGALRITNPNGGGIVDLGADELP